MRALNLPPSRLFRLARRGLLALAVVFAGGCATRQAALTDPEKDPWEPFNRKIYAFNDGFDTVIARPLATVYDAVLPDPPQRGVRNFFRNLAFPVTFVNLILQGKFADSLTATSRFLLNSTAGVGGLFDVATREGVEDFDEDFGQTFAVWGWEDSRYLVLPFFGPHTVRDALGRPPAGYIDPVAYVAREEDEYRPLIFELISLRAELLPFDEDLEEAQDPYVLMRDVYLQNREFKIYDGEPPAPDYDALLEE